MIKNYKWRCIEWILAIYLLNVCTVYFFMYNLRIIYLVGFQLLPMRLGKLENLGLGGNRLNNSILSILSRLSSLKSLDLSKNMFTGSGIIHSFYLNASHDILLIILFLYQEKWGLYIYLKINFVKTRALSQWLATQEQCWKDTPPTSSFITNISKNKLFKNT
jgi:hypothetical protein